MHSRRWTAGAALFALVLLAACSPSGAGPSPSGSGPSSSPPGSEGAGGVVVTFYDAVYDLSVREGRTANPIAQKTVAIAANPSSECSMFKMGGSEGVYPEYTAEMLPLLKAAIGVD